MDGSTLFVFVLAFLAALVFLEGIFPTIRGDERERAAKTKARLREIARGLNPVEVPSADATMVRAQHPKRSFLDRVQLMLLRSGSPQAASTFLALCGAAAVAGFALIFAFTGDAMRAIPGLAVGYLPVLIAKKRAAKRVEKFAEQLPDGLELLTRAMRAGHALSAGFNLVGEETADPLGTEFSLVAEELRFGLDLREALENMTARVDNPDLPYFTTAVLIQRQTGGNLAELLQRLGSMLRARIEFSGRVRAMTAQGRGAATFLALWLPFMIGVLMVFAPEFLNPMFNTFLGQVTLAVVIAINVAAYFMARRIADVQA